jgi:hypothetical protein
MLRQYADSNFARLVLESPEELSKMQRATADEQLKRHHKEIDAARVRFGGGSDRDRLQWAINIAQDPPRTSEGILGFERDVYFYGVLSGRIAFGSAGTGVPTPTKGYGKRILHKFQDTLKRVISRERIPLSSEIRHLTWFPSYKGSKPGYILWTDYRHELESIVFGELCRQIQDYGHLIKQCPAPAVRAKEGETCGKWFLANRPNQNYCKPACLSRKTSRDNPSEKKKSIKRKRIKSTLARARK